MAFAARLSRAVVSGVRAMSSSTANGVPVEVRATQLLVFLLIIERSRWVEGPFCLNSRPSIAPTPARRPKPCPQVHNPSGALRVVVTKSLPGDRWLKVLTASGCRVEVSADPDTILSNDKIKKLIGDKCDGVIGQLTEVGGLALVAAVPGRLASQGLHPPA